MSPAPPPPRPRSDEFDSDDETRRRMSRIRRRDTRPEQALRRALHARGWRYFVDRPVRGVSRCRPDLLFPRLRVAVFVDGCFWHFCPPHTHLPRANAAYWHAKLLANRQRDARHDDELARAGWRVVRVWEHEPLETALAAVETVLVAARVDLARRRGSAERGRAGGPTPARPRRAR